MTAPLPPVRVGTRADEVDLLALCHELHADNGLFEMDDDAVKETLDLAFDRKGAVIGVIDGDAEIAGAILICLTRMWYVSSDSLGHLEELFSFVRPKYRKSKNAEALIEFAKQCTSTGLPVVIGIVTNKRLEAKVRLYRQRLGLPIGAFFAYGIEQWANESIIHTEGLWRVHRNKRTNGVETS